MAERGGGLARQRGGMWSSDQMIRDDSEAVDQHPHPIPQIEEEGTMNLKSFLVPKQSIILAGMLFGTLGALAVNWGNPANMGICAACFLRDIAGALHLHQNHAAQYLRPEVIGFVLGAFAASLAFREWRSRGGSSPFIRFMLGAFVMVGVLVFLGCPIRVVLRIAGGDLGGVVALAGMVVGILGGVSFLKRGFSLGSATDRPALFGASMPLLAVGLLFLLVTRPAFIAFSQTGLGARHMPWLLALGVGLLVGFMFQKTRFCSIGAWRDLFLVKDFHLFGGVAAFLLAALLTNYAAGNFSPAGMDYHWGFTDQPIALPMTNWAEYLMTFLSLGLVGMAGTLLDGCPLRNLIRSGEGDTDAAVTVLGYIAGAAVAHHFHLASSPSGLGTGGPAAVGVGWVFCIAVGAIMVEKNKLEKNKLEKNKSQQAAFSGDSIITFQNVSSAMKAEKAIKTAGYEVKLVAPPPEMRMGCDLALEINLVETPGIERLLQETRAPYVQILPLSKGLSRMCEIVKVTDFGNWIMVKAGNMKLSFEKDSGRIVNISGGGCPDIPYLHAEMVDQSLSAAPHPRDLGYTLCATMLQRAYEEALRYSGGKPS
jgi:YedE family putative selenium metabolism protein